MINLFKNKSKLILFIMKLKIYFTVNDIEDYFIVEGDDIVDVIHRVNEEAERRGLDPDDNDMRSERI